MYRKFRNISIFKDFPLICLNLLGFRVGRYVFGGSGPYSTNTSKRNARLTKFKMLIMHNKMSIEVT